MTEFVSEKEDECPENIPLSDEEEGSKMEVKHVKEEKNEEIKKMKKKEKWLLRVIKDYEKDMEVMKFMVLE